MRCVHAWAVLCWAASVLSGAEAAALSTRGHVQSKQRELELENSFADEVDHMSEKASANDGSGEEEEQDDEDDQDDNDKDNSVSFEQALSTSAAPERVEDTATDEKEPDAAKRVVLLLQTLAQEIRTEGKRERELLEAHLCWCKSEQHSLKVSVSLAEDKIPMLQSEMEETVSSLANLGEAKKKYAADLEDGNSAVRAAEGLRATEKAQAEQLMEDLTANIDAIAKAVESLEAGKTTDARAFLQTPAAKLLQRLVHDPDFQAKVDDTDEGSRGSEAFLAYLEGSRTEGFDEVAGVCKQLQESLEQDLASTKDKEEKAAAAFQKLKQTKKTGMTATGQLVEETNEQLSSLTTRKGRLQDDLDATKESLAEDQMFLKQMTESCQATTSDFHKRQGHRQDELEACKDAVEILSQDTSYLQTQHVASASSARSFLQATVKHSLSKRSGHRRHHTHRRHRAASSSSSAVSAGQGSAAGQQLILGLRGSKGGAREPAVNFKLIRNLIDKTMMILDSAQSKDDKDFEYCTKEIADVEAEQSDLGEKMGDLQAAMSEKNATLTGLVQQISELSASIKEQDVLAANLTAQRQTEHAEHVRGMVASHKAIELLGLAHTRLAKMYGDTPGKALLQSKTLRAPTLSAARPELKTSMGAVGSAATKGADRGTRVLDLIKTLQDGIQQGCATADENEAEAQAEYEKMVESAQEIRSTDSKHLVEREVSRSDTEVRLRALERDIASNEERASLLAKFSTGLHTKCDKLLANYDPHKAARKSEAEALKNAHTTLKAAGPPKKASL